MNRSYYCYILRNKTEQYKNHSYVGFTVNPTRRLRQHNGELVGGAKRTRVGKGDWEFACLITGFPDMQNALQCEWAIKHQKGPGKGAERRIRSLINLLKKERWTNNSIYNNFEQQFTITVLDEFKNLFIDQSNVTVCTVDQLQKENKKTEEISEAELIES